MKKMRYYNQMSHAIVRYQKGNQARNLGNQKSLAIVSYGEGDQPWLLEKQTGPAIVR